jgi:WD repeat-containing protein 45
MSSSSAPLPATLCTSFNQDSTHFAVGLKNGFRFYTTDPLRERMRRDFSDGGIGIVEMVEGTNWIALVGGGRDDPAPQSRGSFK